MRQQQSDGKDAIHASRKEGPLAGEDSVSGTNGGNLLVLCVARSIIPLKMDRSLSWTFGLLYGRPVFSCVRSSPAPCQCLRLSESEFVPGADAVCCLLFAHTLRKCALNRRQ